jgi:hypothetical protein
MNLNLGKRVEVWPAQLCMQTRSASQPIVL